MTSKIKEELDRTGFYSHIYKESGYYCWSLDFEKKDGQYSVTDHLSTESGTEEDLDYFSSDNFDDVINWIRSSGYEIQIY